MARKKAVEKISKKEAKEKGLDKYFTGIKCKYGHISERYVKSGVCVECYKTGMKHAEEVQNRKKGRPSFEFPEFTEKAVYIFAENGLPITDMARIFGVDKDTIINHFSHIIDQAKANMKNRILKKRIELALDENNWQALDSLLKNYVGEKDEQTVNVINSKLKETDDDDLVDLMRLGKGGVPAPRDPKKNKGH